MRSRPADPRARLVRRSSRRHRCSRPSRSRTPPRCSASSRAPTSRPSPRQRIATVVTEAVAEAFDGAGWNEEGREDVAGRRRSRCHRDDVRPTATTNCRSTCSDPMSSRSPDFGPIGGTAADRLVADPLHRHYLTVSSSDGSSESVRSPDDDWRHWGARQREHAVKDYPIKLGTMLFTMVEPHPGHEVAYNRWYEHDHFYAGCMIAEYNFAGDRFVATKRLKELRYPAETPMTPGPDDGQLPRDVLGARRPPRRLERVERQAGQWLHANGRMFKERTHIHTALYDHQWAVQRDEDGHDRRARARPRLRRAGRQRRRVRRGRHATPMSRRGPATTWAPAGDGAAAGDPT